MEAFAAPIVSTRLSREWGEALWTAVDLVDAAFREALADAALRGMFGLPL